MYGLETIKRLNKQASSLKALRESNNGNAFAQSVRASHEKAAKAAKEKAGGK